MTEPVAATERISTTSPQFFAKLDGFLAGELARFCSGPDDPDVG